MVQFRRFLAHFTRLVELFKTRISNLKCDRGNAVVYRVLFLVRVFLAGLLHFQFRIGGWVLGNPKCSLAIVDTAQNCPRYPTANAMSRHVPSIRYIKDSMTC